MNNLKSNHFLFLSKELFLLRFSHRKSGIEWIMVRFGANFVQHTNIHSIPIVGVHRMLALRWKQFDKNEKRMKKTWEFIILIYSFCEWSKKKYSNENHVHWWLKRHYFLRLNRNEVVDRHRRKQTNPWFVFSFTWAIIHFHDIFFSKLHFLFCSSFQLNDFFWYCWNWLKPFDTFDSKLFFIVFICVFFFTGHKKKGNITTFVNLMLSWQNGLSRNCFLLVEFLVEFLIFYSVSVLLPLFLPAFSLSFLAKVRYEYICLQPKLISTVFVLHERKLNTLLIYSF